MTSVLTGVVDDGTAKTSVRENPLRDGQQVAGKTGTSDNNKSAWPPASPGSSSPRSVCSARTTRHRTRRSRCTRPAGVDYRVNGGGPAEIWAAYTFGVTGSGSRR
ncbi:transglycosylase domain-containing protein [Streptomyces violaceorubidus]